MSQSSYDVGIVGLNHGVKTLFSAIEDLPNINKIHFVGSQRSVGKYFEIDNIKSEVISFSEMLLKPEIKVIFVASPPSTHLELVSQALESGISVYCEKPGGLNTSELEQLFQKARLKEVPLAIGYQYRHDPYIQFIKKRLENYSLNQVREIHVKWQTSSALFASRQIWKSNKEMGGEVAKDFLIHVIDYLDFFFPKLFDKSSVETSRFIGRAIGYDELHLEVEINNLILNISVTRFSPGRPEHEINIIGNEFNLLTKRYFPFGINDCSLLVDGEELLLQDLPEMGLEVQSILSNDRYSKNLQIYATSVLVQEFLQSILDNNGIWEQNLDKTLRITKVSDQFQLSRISN